MRIWVGQSGSLPRQWVKRLFCFSQKVLWNYKTSRWLINHCFIHSSQNSGAHRLPWLPLSEKQPVTFITCIDSNLPLINQSSQLQSFSIMHNTYFTSWLEYFIHPLVSEALQTACKFRQGPRSWKCNALFMANLWPMFIFVPRLRISHWSRLEICSRKLLLYWSIRWKVCVLLSPALLFMEFLFTADCWWSHLKSINTNLPGISHSI